MVSGVSMVPTQLEALVHFQLAGNVEPNNPASSEAAKGQTTPAMGPPAVLHIPPTLTIGKMLACTAV